VKLLRIERETTDVRRMGVVRRASNATICSLVIWCLAGGTGSVAQQAKPADQVTARARSNRADGRALFESTCATCHGLDGHGAERGPNIATRPEARRLSDTEILTILRNGRPKSGMPAFGGMGGAKLESLLAHLRNLQGLDRNEQASGNSGHGREIFLQKGGCADCHAVNGVGGFLGPDLSIYGAVTPFVEMREQIAQHDHLPRAKMVTLTTRDGQTLTGMIRNEDNFSLQLQTMDGKFHFLERAELVSGDTKPTQNQAAEGRPSLSGDQVEGLVSYLVEVAKKTDANGKLKRRPVHHEEED
jgi:cytochrome c oxidase cbb3-type subunit 3